MYAIVPFVAIDRRPWSLLAHLVRPRNEDGKERKKEISLAYSDRCLHDLAISVFIFLLVTPNFSCFQTGLAVHTPMTEDGNSVQIESRSRALHPTITDLLG